MHTVDSSVAVRKRPWILVLLNVGALAASIYQIHYLVMMLGNR